MAWPVPQHRGSLTAADCLLGYRKIRWGVITPGDAFVGFPGKPQDVDMSSYLP